VKDKIERGEVENPYIAGMSINGKGMFVGRQDVFDFLKQKFITEKAKHNILLYGGRRVGKTSTLYRIKGGALGDKFIPVFIDLQAIGDMDTYGFFDFVTSIFIDCYIVTGHI
jgi:AAA+ ATPase superfamily predicted ATPase